MNEKSKGNKGETIFQREKRGRAPGIMKRGTWQLKSMGKEKGDI
jgi:hypothetical protein